MKKERTINLKAEEIRAILAGKKTQLRRVTKTQPVWQDSCNPMIGSGWSYQDPKDRFSLSSFPDVESFKTALLEQAACPIGQIGQRLWVRESWGMAFAHDVPKGHPRKMGGTWGVPAYSHFKPCVVYLADGRFAKSTYWHDLYSSPLTMPKTYSRLLLEITGIRIERLQDISQADAIAEGGPKSHPTIDRQSRKFGYPDWSRSFFAQTWDFLRGEGAWASNPWVWVIEFAVIENSATV